MKILSINIRGLGGAEKKRWIRELCSKEKVDMVGIQETKQDIWDGDQVANVWGFDDCDFAQSQAIGNSGGVMLIWDKKVFTCEFFISKRSFVAVVGRWEGVKDLVGFVNVYGPRDHRKRKEVWDMVELLCNKEEVKWCVFGDFNEVRGAHERLNSDTNLNEVESFNEFIRRNVLTEVPMGNQKFTRVSDDGRKFSKLDRFLVTREFESAWRNLGVKVLERKWSDHFPILLKDSDLNFGPKPFKMFDTWLDEDVESLVKEAWSKEVTVSKFDHMLVEKLKNVKLALKEWCNNKNKSLDEELERNKQEVKRLEAVMETRNMLEDEKERWLRARKSWLEAEKRKGIWRGKKQN